jgi:LysM repeat protein
MPEQRSAERRRRRVDGARPDARPSRLFGMAVGALATLTTLSGVALASVEGDSEPPPSPAQPGVDGTSADPVVAVPPVTDDRPAGLTAAVYRVRAGDTLEAVANLHAVPLGDLVEHNDLQPPYLLRPGDQLRIPVPESASPSPSATWSETPLVRSSIERWAAVYHLPPDLVAAVLWQESRWRRDALSHRGAMGVGQLLPATATWVADELVGESLDPWDVDEHIRMSTALLRWLVDLTEGDHAKALARYYQGQGSIARSGWFGETERYVQDVFTWRWQYRLDQSWRTRSG